LLGTDGRSLRDFYASLADHTDAFSLSQLRWFARGPHFDMAILETAMNVFNVSPPWRYNKVRDARTYIECMGHDPQQIDLPVPEAFQEHIAMHDTAMEAMRLQYATANRKPL
jgi:hypothetical protein